MMILRITHSSLRITQDGEIPSYSKDVVYSIQEPRHLSSMHPYQTLVEQRRFSMKSSETNKYLWKHFNLWQNCDHNM